MNKEQKMAWITVITISLALIVSSIAAVTLYPCSVEKILSIFVWAASPGICVYLGFLIFRRPKGKVLFDERDIMIKRNAAFAGYLASWLFMGLACSLPFYILGPSGTVSVVWYIFIPYAALIILGFVTSIAILIQYGWGDKSGK
jgi:hypothetical protein